MKLRAGVVGLGKQALEDHIPIRGHCRRTGCGPPRSHPTWYWRGKTAKAGGGRIIDMGYHLIDMILWYFGVPDRILADLSVSARPDREYDAEDTALIHFAYDSGLYGSLLLSRFIGPKTEQIRLVGSKGMDRKFTYVPGDFHRAEAIHQKTLKLPVWHREEDMSLVDRYIEAFRKVTGCYRDLLG